MFLVTRENGDFISFAAEWERAAPRLIRSQIWEDLLSRAKTFRTKDLRDVNPPLNNPRQEKVARRSRLMPELGATLQFFREAPDEGAEMVKFDHEAPP